VDSVVGKENLDQWLRLTRQMEGMRVIQDLGIAEASINDPRGC
jgi:hypothetical protein